MLSCITSPKDIISEVNFKTKPRKLLSVIVNELASRHEPGPSGIQPVTNSQEDRRSLSREEEHERIDKDISVEDEEHDRIDKDITVEDEKHDRIDKDITVEDGSSRQLSRSKGSSISTKKDKSVLCPKCGKGYTSKKRLLQNHYDEETETCKNETVTEKKQLCPACGNCVSSLHSHYNEETKTCKKSIYSTDVNTVLATQNVSEEELYAVITEVLLLL